MSRKVLVNRLAEVMKCKPEEIPNVNELTSNQMYWILQHEKLHERSGGIARNRKPLDNHAIDHTINPALVK